MSWKRFLKAPGKDSHSFPSYKILEQNLKTGVIDSFYFFTGPEDYLKDQFISRIRKHLQIPPGSINDIVLYPDSPNITEIFSELETQSFFSDNKLIVMRNAESLPSTMLSQLKDVLQRETLEAYVIFTSRSLPYRSSAKQIEKILSRTYHFEVPKKDFRSFLEVFLKNFQKRMTPRAQAMVLELYTSLYDLHHNIEKLALAVEDRELIEEKDLDVLTTCSHTISSYVFLDKLGRRDTASALGLLRDLMARGETFYSLIGLMRSQFITFLKADQMLKNEVPASDVCQGLGIYPFKRDLFLEQLKKFSQKKLVKNIKILSNFDYLSKSSSLDPEHLMEMLVIELCTD
jgi:DNA polymerase III subunit delta